MARRLTAKPGERLFVLCEYSPETGMISVYALNPGQEKAVDAVTGYEVQCDCIEMWPDETEESQVGMFIRRALLLKANVDAMQDRLLYDKEEDIC